MNRPSSALITLGLALLWSAPAAAGDAPHVDAGITTDFPTSVGIRGTVELENRVRLSLGGGVFPRPYLNTIQGIATSAGWYSEELAQVIETALSRAYVLRTHVGWRPWEDRGFFFGGGYMPVLAVGGEVDADQISAAIQASESGYNLVSRLHMLQVEAGWEWLVWERMVVRTSLGGAFTVGSRTEATEVSSSSRFEVLRGAGREGIENYLDNVYQTYVHSPTVGVELGYRFR